MSSRHVLLRDRVLRVLVQQPVARQAATVATLAGISTARARRALGELERRGYAERDRTGCFAATERGRELEASS